MITKLPRTSCCTGTGAGTDARLQKPAQEFILLHHDGHHHGLIIPLLPTLSDTSAYVRNHFNIPEHEGLEFATKFAGKLATIVKESWSLVKHESEVHSFVVGAVVAENAVELKEIKKEESYTIIVESREQLFIWVCERR